MSIPAAPSIVSIASLELDASSKTSIPLERKEEEQGSR